MYNSSFFAFLSPNVIKIVPLYPYTLLPPAVYIISKSKKDKRAKISITTLTPIQLPDGVGDIIENLSIADISAFYQVISKLLILKNIARIAKAVQVTI